MGSSVVRRGLGAFAAFMLLIMLSAGAVPASHAVLQFVPLIAVAPEEPEEVTAGPLACKAPVQTPPAFSSKFIHCYTPTDIRAAYGVDALHAEGITGAGQTIVIVDSYGSPTALNDLQVFSQTFGLPDPDLTIIHPTGTPTFSTVALGGAQVGWAFETSLDLQWAHAIAPDAKIVLMATNPAETEGVQGFPNMFIAEQLAVEAFPGSPLSQSFAATEQSFHAAAPAQVARFNEVYQRAVDQNMTVLGSSGDTGTANVDKQLRVFPFPTVNWPSSDPLVTSAGGTWLQFGWKWHPTVTTEEFFSCLAAGNPVNFCRSTYLAFDTTPGGRTEAVWREDWRQIATGGGLSVLFATPGFQTGISPSILKGSRGLPDVSWNAAVDGGVLVFTTFPGTRLGWHIVGGTSASSPQLAALVALANQLRQQQGKGPVGYLNPKLYQLPSSDFLDIVPQTFGTGAVATTLNNNAQFGSGIAGMPTTPGWDLTTGFGSPKAHQFVHDLATLP